MGLRRELELWFVDLEVIVVSSCARECLDLYNSLLCSSEIGLEH